MRHSRCRTGSPSYLRSRDRRVPLGIASRLQAMSRPSPCRGGVMMNQRPKKHHAGYVTTEDHEAVLAHCKHLTSKLADRTRERDRLLRKLELQEDVLRN